MILILNNQFIFCYMPQLVGLFTITSSTYRPGERLLATGFELFEKIGFSDLRLPFYFVCFFFLTGHSDGGKSDQPHANRPGFEGGLDLH